MGDRGSFHTLVRANGSGLSGGSDPDVGGVDPDVGGVVPDVGGVVPDKGGVDPDDGVVVVSETGAEVTGEPGLNGAVVGSGGVLTFAGGGGSALEVAGLWVARAGTDFFFRRGVPGRSLVARRFALRRGLPLLVRGRTRS